VTEAGLELTAELLVDGAEPRWCGARTYPDRFKAALMGAGISDWGMQVGVGELGTQEAGLGGSCGWEGPGPHRRQHQIDLLRRIRAWFTRWLGDPKPRTQGARDGRRDYAAGPADETIVP
jgi:hypothetical protein